MLTNTVNYFLILVLSVKSKSQKINIVFFFVKNIQKFQKSCIVSKKDQVSIQVSISGKEDIGKNAILGARP